MTRTELLEKKAFIKQQIWKLEKKLRNKSLVSAIDFASMYPNIIRLLNASIESLVGFLDDDPIAYRAVGLSSNVRESKEKSKELLKTRLADSKHAKFVGKNEEKVALRIDLYNGLYDDASIDEITESPFEKFFLACMGVFNPDEIEMKFQGKKYTVTELMAYFKKMDYCVSGAGAVFKNSLSSDGEQGLIPSYLGYLFNERKKVKKEMAVNFKHKILLQKFKMAADKDKLLK